MELESANYLEKENNINNQSPSKYEIDYFVRVMSNITKDPTLTTEDYIIRFQNNPKYYKWELDGVLWPKTILAFYDMLYEWNWLRYAPNEIKEIYKARKRNDNYKSSNIKLTSLKRNVEINNTSNNEKYEEAKELIWKEQLDFFKNTMKKIVNSNNLSDAIIYVQENSEYNGKIDWKLWPKTMEAFYNMIYDLNRLKYAPREIKDRYRAKRELDEYPNNPREFQWRTIRSTRVPNVIQNNNDYFYGEANWENIKWYYLNEKLFNTLWKKGILEKTNYENWGNSINLRRIGSKYYLAMYVDWSLQVLTYISPGKFDKQTPDNRNYNLWNLDKYHISSSYPERDWINKWWAIMPFAINIRWPIWLHVWRVNWRWLSHGCIRVPVYYQQRIFKLVEKFWNQNFKVNIWDLY